MRSLDRTDRIAACLGGSQARGERLLVVYLTIGDPVADPVELALSLVRAGADVLEFGIPTAQTSPRGTQMAASFERARSCSPERAFEIVGQIRAELPEVPLLALTYPQTITDVGASRLTELAVRWDLDGLVLTDPDGPLSTARTAAAGLSAVPLICVGADPARRAQLEADARHLTYAPLADRTGVRLGPGEAGRTAAWASVEAGRPFLAGFGLRDEADIRAVARYAAGVVVGTELYRVLASSQVPDNQQEDVEKAVRTWKAATVLKNPQADTQTAGE